MNPEKKENPNTEYEKLSQEVYKCLLKAEGLENIEVKHDVKLKGRSGSFHQIDVYWEFKQANEIHRVAIECKNYKNPVSIGAIRNFSSALDDIGNIKGIYVTKNGYQSGAIIFAEHRNISLKLVRPPENEDWKGTLKRLEIELSVMPKEVISIFVALDYEWMRANKGIQQLETNKTVTLETQRKLNGEMFLYDATGNRIENFLELENKLPHNYEAGENFTHFFHYDDAYIDSLTDGRVKIKSIHFTYNIHSIDQTIVIDAEEITRAILKDINSGEVFFISNDGSVKKRPK